MEEQKVNGSVNVAAQEVSSTTQVVEVNKRSLRVQTWRKIQDNKCGIGFNGIFNKIPNFLESEKAAAALAATEEFKNAKNIKVNIDRAQDAVKLEVLNAVKNLYLPAIRNSNALFTKVDCPADADEETKKQVIKVQHIGENRTEIPLENKVDLDMIVVGSVVVSRDGYRIGRGNGFIDLDIGLLIQTGALTPNTIIATTVHDYQVVDSLPKDLFQKYDTPVDIIVTPTEVIKVSNRLPRPTGLFWELISERRMKIVPVLQVIKENEEKAGKVIALKAEDTDVEENNKKKRERNNKRRQPRTKNNRRIPKSQTDNENNENDNENIEEGKTDRPKRRQRFNRRRRTTKSEGEQSGAENKDESKPENQGQQNQRRKRTNRDFCVKISNISRGIRIKDLKSELRKRECNPIYISWKGQYGRCYLHFAKKVGTEKETDADKVLQSLNDLSLTVQAGENSKTVNLAVELLNIEDENNRIESVDTTTV